MGSRLHRTRRVGHGTCRGPRNGVTRSRRRRRGYSSRRRGPCPGGSSRPLSSFPSPDRPAPAPTPRPTRGPVREWNGIKGVHCHYANHRLLSMYSTHSNYPAVPENPRWGPNNLPIIGTFVYPASRSSVLADPLGCRGWEGGAGGLGTSAAPPPRTSGPASSSTPTGSVATTRP